MRRVATILAGIAVAATLGACGAREDAGWSQGVTDAGGFNVRGGTESLPDGHPPLDGHGRALPHGHPRCRGTRPGSLRVTRCVRRAGSAWKVVRKAAGAGRTARRT